MVSVKIQEEADNGKEYGYGVYINGYVYDNSLFDGENTFVGHYASECIPVHCPDEWLKAAKNRVRSNARRRYIAERCSQMWLV